MGYTEIIQSNSSYLEAVNVDVPEITRRIL
ncbi:hypothetical protein V144x_20660 [Gimesia aquarii]|uniref:Uncharacterized protein n=1 Tax=Gimesia aquarii TaxID=2527964 RepID=A0A517VUC6_9PLAN|nr:hypothetical protein V144x_20660 [Gimesia aquarii]